MSGYLVTLEKVVRAVIVEFFCCVRFPHYVSITAQHIFPSQAFDWRPQTDPHC